MASSFRRFPEELEKSYKSQIIQSYMHELYFRTDPKLRKINIAKMLHLDIHDII